MKKTTLGMMMAAALLATSCLSEQQNLEPKNEGSQKGKIVLSVNAGTEFGQQTRALNENSYKETANYTVQIYNNDNPTRLLVDCKYSQLDANMPGSFQPGTYTVKAFYGTEANYSRDDFYVIGEKSDVTVNAGDEVNVPLTCKPTCGKLSVEFESKMADYYDYYDVAFSQAAALGGGSIAWTSTDSAPWYVKLNEAGETLRYTINVTAKDEYAYTDAEGNKTTTGVVTDEFLLERNKAYKLIVKPIYNQTGEGGLSISIEIDVNTNNPIDVPVVVPIEWL